MVILGVVDLVSRAADRKLPKVDWDLCPDPLFGRDYGPILLVSFNLPFALKILAVVDL